MAEHALAIGALRSEPAFAGLGTPALHALVRCAKRRVVPRYASTYRAGADSAHVFILLDGRLQRLSASGEEIEGESVAVDGLSLRGVCFGMEALVTSGGSLRGGVTLRRTRTVHAASDCTVLQIGVDDLMRHIPDVLAAVRRTHFAHYVQAELHGMPIFDGISAETLQSLAPLWELEDHGAAGSRIFDEGDKGDRLYVLLTGRVSVLRGETVLTSLDADPADHAGPNGERSRGGHPFFGEMALLDGKPRMAAVASKTPCTLLVLPQRAFAQFMQAVPDFKRRLRTYKELRARQSELKVAIAAERSKRADDENDQDRVKRLIRAASALGSGV